MSTESNVSKGGSSALVVSRELRVHRASSSPCHRCSSLCACEQNRSLSHGSSPLESQFVLPLKSRRRVRRTARSVRHRIMAARDRVERTLIGVRKTFVKASALHQSVGKAWVDVRRLSCRKSSSSRLSPLVVVSRVGNHERIGSKQLVIVVLDLSSPPQVHIV